MTGNTNCTRTGPMNCVIASAALLMTAGTAQAGASGFEEHSFSIAVTDPIDFDQSYSVSTAITQFDTLGGTRQLDEVFFEWRLEFGWEADVAGTPTGDLAMQADWTVTWTGELPGGLSIPTDGPQVMDVSRVFYIEGGNNPHTQSASPDEVGDETISSAAYLTALTGTGTVNLDSSFGVSALTISDPDIPGATYDPTLADIHGVDMTTSLTVVYFYSTVPSPGALALFGLGGLSTGRRRRH